MSVNYVIVDGAEAWWSNSGPGLSLAGVIVLFSWTRHFTLTVPLLTQEYEWVLANCWGNLNNASGYLQWTSIPSRGVAILLVVLALKSYLAEPPVSSILERTLTLTLLLAVIFQKPSKTIFRSSEIHVLVTTYKACFFTTTVNTILTGNSQQLPGPFTGLQIIFFFFRERTCVRPSHHFHRTKQK